MSGAATKAASQWLTRLAVHGYCVIPDLIEPKVIERLNSELDPHFTAQPFSRGAFYGERTKRFGGLLNRSGITDRLIRQPLVLEIAEGLLEPWCERIALNLTQGIEIHPGAPAQFPHRDQDMWGGPKGEVEYLLNVMWPLTPFRQENGATLVWPGSHLRHDEAQPQEEPTAVEMEPGSALLFLGSTLHGGGANRSDASRRGIIISYCLGWLKPFENQWLVYPPTIARHFEPELAALVGYAQHRPNLGNVEGQCPSKLLYGEAHGPAPAVDALRPDQAEALEQWSLGQR